MTLPEPPCTTLHLPSAPANCVHLGLKLLRKIEILRRRCERRKQVHNQRHRGPFGGSLLQRSSRLERAVEARPAEAQAQHAASDRVRGEEGCEHRGGAGGDSLVEA